MQITTKPAQTVKFVAFSVKYTAVVTPQNCKRPAEDDPRRECWNRAAKLFWRIFIIALGFIIALALRSHYEETATVSMVADRLPEIIGEIGEYIKKI